MKNLKFGKLLSFILLSGLLIFVILFSFYVYFYNEEIKSLYLITTINQFPTRKEKPITLMFVGDIMLDRGVKYMVEEYGRGDYKFPFLKIADYLNTTDILFANLESIISDKGEKVGSIYSFRAEPQAIEGLKFAGFDIVSVANNHIFDYGRGAMEDSFWRLKEGGIDYVGSGFNEREAYSPIIKEVEGVKIAFLAFTNLGSEHWSAREDQSGPSWLTTGNLERGIKKAKDEADLVIVSMHFGEEYLSSPTSEQEFFARLAIDAGVDLVVGHHSHIIQPIEKHGQGFIAYSLGNFVFDQAFSDQTLKGLLLKVIIEDAKIKELIPIEIKINQYFQPEIIKQ